MNPNGTNNFTAGKWRNAIVIMANWKDFVPGMSFCYKKVQSRFFIWSRYGSGSLVVNRRTYPLRQGDYLFLPWNHSITYKPDSTNPFSVGCIHIIPDMEHEDKIYYNPFHWERPELPDYFARHDEVLEGYENVVSGHTALDSSLLQLGRYIIDRFQFNCPEEMLRTFPRQLLFELEWLRQRPEQMDRSLPPLTAYILSQLDAVSLDTKSEFKNIEEEVGISQATLYRMFKKELGMTPRQYILNRKLEFCAYLLRNTRLTTRQIAEKTDLDLSFFSRTFRRKYQLPPGQFRKSSNIANADTELFRYKVKKYQQKFHAEMKTW